MSSCLCLDCKKDGNSDSDNRELQSKVRKKSLTKIIEHEPGIQFREIMRSSGLKNGVLSHYLGKLEKNGVIKVIRGPRQSRFYPPQITEDESIVIKALRKQTPHNLLLALIKKDGLRFSQLVQEVKKSPSTVSLCLSQLIKDDIVTTTKDFSRKRKYHFCNKQLVGRLVTEYKIKRSDQMVSGFEDIINSM
jgi:predicted transcriptional regulator